MDDAKDLTPAKVTMRTCPCCGHHEVGVVVDGEFHQLKDRETIWVEKRAYETNPSNSNERR